MTFPPIPPETLDLLTRYFPYTRIWIAGMLKRNTVKQTPADHSDLEDII